MDTGFEYVITADYGALGRCLVRPLHLGADRQEEAFEILKQMKYNPTPADIRQIGKGTDLQLKEVPLEYCWWNDPFLAN